MVVTPEEILKLLDSYWFEHEIFSTKTGLSISYSSAESSVQEDEEHPKIERPELPEIAVFQVRSFSDRCLRCNTDFSPDLASPKSVISTPGLEKILSGKEIGEIEIKAPTTKKKAGGRRKRSGSRRKRISRSLSELEYEELKGFMDLGFVFTEEDKTSSLVSILPGLQRWGKKSGEDEPISIVKDTVSRPYLSEAWDVYNQRTVNKPPVNWRFPATSNENNMKLHLKAWAHIVASSVR